MKIAMIGHKRIPGREGGIEVVVEELVKRMAQNNDVVVYNRKKKGAVSIKEYEGARIVNVPTIEKKSLDAVVYSLLASIHALFCGYDVIHYHALGPSVMLLIPKLFKKKIVVTVHGLNYKTPKWKGFGERYIKLGEKIVAQYADAIITLNSEQTMYFKRKYNRKTVFIPNGISIQDVKEPYIIKNKWGLEKNKYFLLVSRLVPGKGIELLIEAYKNVHTDIPLVIVGDSQYVDEFKKKMYDMASRDERVKFTGFADGDELIELYSNARAFVFPSEAEGMPMCLLEAMSYNLPCIVSNIPENVEVGKGYVVTFELGNVSDLEKKITYYVDDDNLPRNLNSKEYIQKKYNWDAVTKRTLQVYDEIRG